MARRCCSGRALKSVCNRLICLAPRFGASASRTGKAVGCAPKTACPAVVGSVGVRQVNLAASLELPLLLVVVVIKLLPLAATTTTTAATTTTTAVTTSSPPPFGWINWQLSVQYFCSSLRSANALRGGDGGGCRAFVRLAT